MRCEARERVEDHQSRHPLGIVEGERHRDGAAKRFADDDRAPVDGRNRVHDSREIVRERIQTIGVVSERISGDAVGSLEEWNLAVEQLSTPVHARDEDDRIALTMNRQTRVVHVIHRRYR